MVDLPSVTSKQPTLKEPTERSLPTPRVYEPQLAEIPSPLRDVAKTLSFAGEQANTVAKDMAREAGLRSVTRDENGNVQVEKYPIIGEAAASFRSAMETAAITDGEKVVKSDMLDLRKKFEFDPEGFRGAAAEYSKTKAKQYEDATGQKAVGLSLGRAADNMAIETYRGLLNSKERRDLARATSSIEAQVDTAKNELFALAAGGDNDSPEFNSRLQKVGALWGQMAANPRLGISPDRVAYEMSQLQSELTVARLGYRMETIQKERGTPAALAEADKIKTDTSLNLTPTQRLSLHTRLVGGIQHRVMAANTVDRATNDEIGAVGKLAEEGFGASPERMATLRRTVAESGNPVLASRLQNVETIMPIIQDWKKASPAQLERNLSDLDEAMRKHGASEELMTLRQTGTELLKNMRTSLKSDPLTWANRTGAMAVPPIDLAAPDAAGQMRDRAARAESVAQHYGIAPQYLMPDERRVLENVTSHGGQPMLDVAERIVTGFGDRSPKVLAELSKQSPVVAHIGALMTSQGSQSLMLDAAEAVRLRNLDTQGGKAGEAARNLPTWFKTAPDTFTAPLQQRRSEVYGTAFTLNPETGRVAEQTAREAFSVRMLKAGGDPHLDKNDKAKPIFDRALQEAAGATYDGASRQFGGIADYKTGFRSSANKVLIPGNIRADSFKDVIGALKDEDLAGAVDAKGRPYTAREIQSAVPVAGKGGYRFSVGDANSDSPKWIRGADGKAFVLDLDKLEPELRKRVPGAYAGN